jgi:hypothetical protein
VVWIGMHIATLIYQKWPYQDWCLGYNTQRTVIDAVDHVWRHDIWINMKGN